MYNLDYLSEIASNAFNYIKGLITLDNKMFLLVFAIFVTNYLFKIIALNEKKIELKKNILNIIKLLPVCIFLGYLTIIYACAYSICDDYLPLNTVLMYLIFIMLAITLIYFILVGIIYKYYHFIVRAIKKLYHQAIKILKNKDKNNQKTKKDI